MSICGTGLMAIGHLVGVTNTMSTKCCQLSFLAQEKTAQRQYKQQV